MAKKLYRAREENSYIGGVCAGVAEYFDIDPTLVRLFFLFIVLMRGTGLVAYIIAWIVIPRKPAPSCPESDQGNKMSKQIKENNQGKNENNGKKGISKKDENPDKSTLLGITLMVLGAIFFVDFWIPGFYWRRFWPLVLIGVGIFIIIKD